MTPSQTQHVKFSEAEIKRLAGLPEVRQVRDPRYPPLMLRFGRDRNRASWLLVRHGGGKSQSKKIANWPDLPVKAAIELMPVKLAELTADPSAMIGAAGWVRVGDLLTWFNERAAVDRGLSKNRRDNIRSLINCQLLPRLSSLNLVDVDGETVDERLIWPMQEVRSLAYTRQAFALLKQAFKRAKKLKKLTINPLGDVVFSDFTEVRIRPKPCAIRPQQLPEIISKATELWVRDVKAAMLVLLMLCHGTRIHETTLAKWSDFDLVEGGEWFLPADQTKTRADHRLPLTAPVLAMLKAYRHWQHLAGYRGVYLFPRGDGQPLADRQAQDKVALFGGEWSAHDLRKIARTMWADLGVDYLIGELLLNHALRDLDAAYIHTHAQVLKREALQRWHACLETHGLSFFAIDTSPGQAASGTDHQANPHAALSAV